jgi:hypothetical protein
MQTSLGVYFTNQISSELANTPNRSYNVIHTGTSDWIINGEIIVIANNVRIYARLLRRDDHSIVAIFQTDLQRTDYLSLMLTSLDSSSSSSAIPDIYEPDSMDNPLLYQIGSDRDDATLVNRTIHRSIDGIDEDFFLLIPNETADVLMETTGQIDTFMELYDANLQRIASDDDSGEGSNPLIIYRLQAGTRYIVKVFGYSENVTGEYAFRAYNFVEEVSDPIVYIIGNNADAALNLNNNLYQRATDIYILEPTTTATVAMETRGDIDTYMELFDAQSNEMLYDDDDSGESYNARIEYRLQAGKRYIVRVRGFNSEVQGQYIFRAYIVE